MLAVDVGHSERSQKLRMTCDKFVEFALLTACPRQDLAGQFKHQLVEWLNEFWLSIFAILVVELGQCVDNCFIMG